MYKVDKQQRYIAQRNKDIITITLIENSLQNIESICCISETNIVL